MDFSCYIGQVFLLHRCVENDKGGLQVSADITLYVSKSVPYDYEKMRIAMRVRNISNLRIPNLQINLLDNIRHEAECNSKRRESKREKILDEEHALSVMRQCSRRGI